LNSTQFFTHKQFLPLRLRSFQPDVSLPLKSGRKSESAAFAASARESKSRAVFMHGNFWQSPRDSKVWPEARPRRIPARVPNESRREHVSGTVGFPKRLRDDRARCKKLFRAHIPCTRRLDNVLKSFCCWDVCRAPAVHALFRPRCSFVANRFLPVPRSRLRRDVWWPGAYCPARGIPRRLGHCDS